MKTKYLLIISILILSFICFKNAAQEIEGLQVWTLEYRIPFNILEKYNKIVQPSPGVIWRANFDKGAGNNSHPHSLMWSLITGPKGSFHQPQYFGELRFE